MSRAVEWANSPSVLHTRTTRSRPQSVALRNSFARADRPGPSSFQRQSKFRSDGRTLLRPRCWSRRAVRRDHLHRQGPILRGRLHCPRWVWRLLKNGFVLRSRTNRSTRGRCKVFSALSQPSARKRNRAGRRFSDCAGHLRSPPPVIPSSTHTPVNLRGVNFCVHRSHAWRGRVLHLCFFIVGLMAGLTLAGWIAGIKP